MLGDDFETEARRIFQLILNSNTSNLTELARLAELDIKEDFIGADLSNLDLSNSDFSQANLSGVDLSGSNLIHSNFDRAILNGSCLDNANFSFTNLRGADLRRSSLECTNFWGSEINNETLFSLPKIASEALKKKRPILELCLKMPQEYGNEAPLFHLSQILHSLQANMNSFGQAVFLLNNKEIPKEISNLTRMNVTSFFAGSFGIQVAPFTESDVFFEESFSEDIIEEFFKTIKFARDPERLQSELLKLKHTTAKTYKNFLKKLENAHAGLSIRWSSCSQLSRNGVAELAYSDIEFVLESVNEIGLEEYKIIELKNVKLISAHDETRYFLIKDLDDLEGKKYKGYITTEAWEDAVRNNQTLEIGSSYSVVLKETVKSFLVSDEVQFKHEIIHFHRLGETA